MTEELCHLHRHDGRGELSQRMSGTSFWSASSSWSSPSSMSLPKSRSVLASMNARGGTRARQSGRQWMGQGAPPFSAATTAVPRRWSTMLGMASPAREGELAKEEMVSWSPSTSGARRLGELGRARRLPPPPSQTCWPPLPPSHAFASPTGCLFAALWLGWEWPQKKYGHERSGDGCPPPQFPQKLMLHCKSPVAAALYTEGAPEAVPTLAWEEKRRGLRHVGPTHFLFF